MPSYINYIFALMSTSSESKNTKIVRSTNFGWLSILISSFLVFYRFRHFILNPGKYTTAINGDPNITLYNMIWHVKYDKSYTKLDSMNYPNGEFIFMTDVNGVLSSIMKFFNDHIYDISDHIPAIFRYFVFICLIAGAYIMYRVLKRLSVDPLLAAVLSPAILLMAPEMIRIGPHLSQGFPFVLPLAILYWLRKVRVQKNEWRDLLFFMLLGGIFLNNVYIGTIALSFILAASIIHTWLNKRSWRIPLTTVILPVFVVLAGLYMYIKLNDPFDDRLKIQWGFFNYNMNPAGYFYSPHSIIDNVLESWGIKKPRITFEKSMFLGLFAGLTAIYLFFKNTVGRIFKTKIHRFSPEVISMFIASFLMLVYAMNSNVFPFLKEIGEENMGPLLMFKASARFGRPMYYVVGILTAIFFTRLIKEHTSCIKCIPYFIGFLWIAEAFVFMKNDHVASKYENPFNNQRYHDLEKVTKEKGINTDNYQAMFFIPLYQGWHENMMSEPTFFTDYTGHQLAVMTGIPQINSRLSRNSTEATLRSAQMCSTPLIKKRVLDILPNNKDILLVTSDHHPPKHEGERYMISLADTIYHNERYGLLRLSVDTVKKYAVYDHVLNRARKDSISKPAYPYIVNHFNDNTYDGIYGYAGIIKEGKHVYDTLRIDLEENRTYTLSQWHFMTHEKYGTPEFFITVQTDSTRYEKYLNPRQCRNVYKNWLQMYIDLPLNKGKNEVSLRYVANQDFIVDEFILRDKQDTIVYKQPDENAILVNGFLLEK